MEFPQKRLVFCADIIVRIESVWVRVKARNSILCGLQNKMSDVQMYLFAVYGYIEFYCQKMSVDLFCVCALRVD